MLQLFEKAAVEEYSDNGMSEGRGAGCDHTNTARASEWAKAHFFFAASVGEEGREGSMALKLEEVRALANRVAASHGLDVVDVEYLGGGGKHRTLRVFIEKNEAERAKLRQRVEQLQAGSEDGDELGQAPDGELDQAPDVEEETDALGDEDFGDAPQEEALNGDEDADELFLSGLPKIANLELLSGITHEDCEVFSRDFGTVLDVEELVPGTEYLLEISSPGLDRRLSQAADYRRFAGSQVKLQTFEPVEGKRHWQGRIVEVRGESVAIELAGSKKPAKKAKKDGSTLVAPVSIEIALGNIEKAHLVPEF